MNSFEFTEQYEALPSQAEYQAYVGAAELVEMTKRKMHHIFHQIMWSISRRLDE